MLPKCWSKKYDGCGTGNFLSRRKLRSPVAMAGAVFLSQCRKWLMSSTFELQHGHNDTWESLTDERCKLIFPSGSLSWENFIWNLWFGALSHLKCLPKRSKSIVSHSASFHLRLLCMRRRKWLPFMWYLIHSSIWLVSRVPFRALEIRWAVGWSIVLDGVNLP